jgi:methionyl-tRNA formyltransferase
MTGRKPGIIFMGTPQFAVPSLEILIQNGYPVKAVVTASDKPSGRGLKTREPAVKTAAVASGIPVLQPVNLKDDDFREKLRRFAADIFVVVAFRMLPEKIWSIPPMGTVNLHASLLPLYRGAAPINHAIINGEKITGVTTFLIEKEIDTGNILFQEKTEIAENDNAGTLHDRLMQIGAGLLLKTVAAIADGTAVPLPQNDVPAPADLPRAPKIHKNDCRINWEASVEKVYNYVRGLSPYPAAWTILHSAGRTVNLKIYEVEKITRVHNPSPGKVTVQKDRFIIDTVDGSVLVRKVQAEGRKAMAGSEFVKGFRPESGAYCL